MTPAESQALALLDALDRETGGALSVAIAEEVEGADGLLQIACH